MLRDDREMIAKSLMAYKRELRAEIERGSDLDEYNQVEIEAVDDLATRLELDRDYFPPEREVA